MLFSWPAFVQYCSTLSDASEESPALGVIPGPPPAGVQAHDWQDLWSLPHPATPRWAALALHSGLHARHARAPIASLDEIMAAWGPAVSSPRAHLVHYVWSHLWHDPRWGPTAPPPVFQQIDRLLQAVLHNDLHVVYQPIIDWRRGRIHSAEALVRWDYDNTLLLPHQFLPFAHFAKLMDLVDWVVWTTVLQDWPDLAQTNPTFVCSVNVGSHLLTHPQWPVAVLHSLAQAGLPFSAISFEILENVVITPAVVSAISTLASQGCHIALDDFGTKSSAFSSLAELTIRFVKLDQSLIRHAGQSLHAAEVVQALVTLLHSLHVLVVAEGVETLAEQRLCQQWQCDLIQGFALAYPMPKHALLASMNSYKEVPLS